MPNQIFVNPQRFLGSLDRNVFGGFAEHLGRCIYGGIYEPASPLADANGFRTDVLAALRRLKMPLIRYPGGNFVSGYRWRDGVGLRDQRPARTGHGLAHAGNQPVRHQRVHRLLPPAGNRAVSGGQCGDGDMREARDWVEYCNGTQRHGPGQAAPAARLRSPAPRPVLGHRQRGGRPLADRLQDAPGIRPHLPPSSPRS